MKTQNLKSNGSLAVLAYCNASINAPSVVRSGRYRHCQQMMNEKTRNIWRVLRVAITHDHTQPVQSARECRCRANWCRGHRAAAVPTVQQPHLAPTSTTSLASRRYCRPTIFSDRAPRTTLCHCSPLAPAAQ